MPYRVVSDTEAIEWEGYRILHTPFKHKSIAEGTADLLRAMLKANGQPRYANVRVEESE